MKTTTTTPLLWLPIRTSWTFTCQCKQFWILLNQAVFLRYHLLQIYFPDLRLPNVPTQVHCVKSDLIFRSNYQVFPQWSKNYVILVSSLFKHYTRRLYWVHLIITFAIIPSPHQAVERPQVLQLTTIPPFAKSPLSPSASLLNCQSSSLWYSLNLLSGLAGHLSPLEPLLMYLLSLLKSEQIVQQSSPSFTNRNLSATLLLKT